MHNESLVMLILGWILFGGIVGVLARALMPGRQPMGWVGTIALGIVGSFIGGLFGNFIFGGGRLFVMQTTGWIGSVVGALIALALLTVVTMRRPHMGS